MSDVTPAAVGKVVYLMRGLPSSGKSHTARALAGDDGVICETDSYFHTEIGDDPERYDYDPALLEKAREWNLGRFREALEQGRSPVIVDRGNGLSAGTQLYAQMAVEFGYAVELQEPDSPWWQEIRVLLKYPKHTGPILDMWAGRLAELNQKTHRTSPAEIRRRMQRWKNDLSVEEILRYQPGEKQAAAAQNRGKKRNPGTVKKRQLVMGPGTLPRPSAGGARWPPGNTSESVLVFDDTGDDASDNEQS